jgi:hypothetical protein
MKHGKNPVRIPIFGHGENSKDALQTQAILRFETVQKNRPLILTLEFLFFVN